MSEVNDVNIVFDYANYDKVGNRLSMKVDDANADVYTYDCLYQLNSVDYNDGNSTSYSYDSLGNRTDVNDGSSTSYLRNCLNQYVSVGGSSYSYDDNGNLTNDGTYKYYYDCENRLTDVNEVNDTAVASYSYNYEGRRISKTIGLITKKFCYDGDQVIAEYAGSTLLRKFVYGPGIDEPICMVDVADNNAVYYYHFDGLGSVAALSDVNSVIVERYSYDVFGEPNRESSLNNPYLFTGRRYDIETGLYYYRARYYKPGIGRFLQADPIGYIAGMNMYAYVGNNPVRFTDPLGLVNPGMGDFYWGGGGFPGAPHPPSPPGFSNEPYPRDPYYFGPPGLMPGPSMPQPGDRCCKLYGRRVYELKYGGNFMKCVESESAIPGPIGWEIGVGEYIFTRTGWGLVAAGSDYAMAGVYCMARGCLDWGKRSPCGDCE